MVRKANYNPKWAWKLDEVVYDLVEWLQHRIGEPLTVTSGYRTPADNARVGGVPDSAHLKGLAVDIACSGDRLRSYIVSFAVLAGVKRIGVYEKHVHLDIDPELPQQVCWIEAKP